MFLSGKCLLIETRIILLLLCHHVKHHERIVLFNKKYRLNLLTVRADNEKSPGASRQGFFFVAEGGLFYDPLWITAQRKNPGILLRRLPGLFYFFTHVFKLRLMLRSKQKTPALSHQGFFFVAEGGFEPPTFGL